MEVVSSLLAATKDLLDRPPAPAGIDLPEVSRSIGEVVRRLKVVPTPPSRSEGRSISLDPGRVDLPEAGPAGGSKGAELPGGAESSLAKTSDDQPTTAVAAGLDPAPSPGAIPSAPLRAKTGRATADSQLPSTDGPSQRPAVAGVDPPIMRGPEAPDRPEQGASPGARSAPAVALQVGGSGAFGPGLIGDQPARADAGSVDQPAGRPDPIRVDGAGRPSVREGIAPTTVAAVGRPREDGGPATPQGPRGLSGPESPASRVAHAGVAADPQAGRAVPAESPMSFVRNPPATDLRAASQAGPAPLGQGGATAAQVGTGMGPGDQASAGPASSQDGASGDLSRTNELLQQLIDAVRKQRGSSLPPGGASVYPDR